MYKRQSLTKQAIAREEIREYLNPVYDLERLMTKVSYQTINPRDMIALKVSLQWLPPIKTILEECGVSVKICPKPSFVSSVGFCLSVFVSSILIFI